MFDVQPLIDSFNSPPTRHAMMVHWPIVLAFIAAIMTLLAVALRSNRTCLTLAVIAQLAFAAASFITLSSGNAAEAAIHVALSTEARESLAEHEQLASRLWLFGAAGAVLLVIGAFAGKSAGVICSILALGVSAFGVAWVGQTAHHGGELVYRHGVGPIASANTPASQPSTRSALPPDVDPTKAAFFLDQAYPILSEYCFNCHNAAKVARDNSGLLDQTSIEGMLLGGESGPALVIGKPEESLMVHRMRSEDAIMDPMPPDGRLTDAQIAIIEQWIRDGAVWVDPAGQ